MTSPSDLNDMSSEFEIASQVAANGVNPAAPNSPTTMAQDKMRAPTTADALQGLDVEVRDQRDVEREVMAELNMEHKAKEDERDRKLIEKTIANRDKLLTRKNIMSAQRENRLMARHKEDKMRADMTDIDLQIKELNADIQITKERLATREAQHAVTQSDIPEDYSNKAKPGESRREFLIRTGKITPFAVLRGAAAGRPDNDLARVMLEAEMEEAEDEATHMSEPQSHRILRKPGFAPLDQDNAAVPARKVDYSQLTAKRREGAKGISDKKTAQPTVSGGSRAATPESAGRPQSSRSAPHGDTENEASIPPSRKRRPTKAATKQSSMRPRKNGNSDDAYGGGSDASFVDDGAFEEPDEDFDNFDDDDSPRPSGSMSRKGKSNVDAGEDVLVLTDDGDEAAYKKRLNSWIKARSALRAEMEGVEAMDAGKPEWEKPSPTAEGHTIEDGVTIPGDIYPTLFNYQKVGVQWLSELHARNVGGIVGDEMGLGKTIQIVSFLASLHHSGKLNRPALIVCPATVMQQWVNEFHVWWPAIRVSILHSSGSGMLNLNEESRYDDSDEATTKFRRKPRSEKAAKGIVDRVLKSGHVLVTSYAGLETYGRLLTNIQWGYAVLDEGHKIKNPDTKITVLCKELQTHNRVILSGTILQNKMSELWSLYDFVYPMLLGTLVSFRDEFETPIIRGGYANASNVERLTAEKVATTLRETIGEYLLQRYKVDVASDLPEKTEHTLAVKFTKQQAQQYRAVLGSDLIQAAQGGRANVLEAISRLRKVCNHPHLLDPENRRKLGTKWGDPKYSGKMHITEQLIHLFKSRGDKMVLFSQSTQMMDILQKRMNDLGDIRFLRLDGKTPTGTRQTLVHRFNTDPDLDLLIASTRVGGLGVNLTGANGVIIFDPDWNPATDTQARERVWRLGQKKPVTIYRLMCKYTIEEKMYHRQIYKQGISDKILKDSTAIQRFSPGELKDLFTYDIDHQTADVFEGAERRIQGDEHADGTYVNSKTELGGTMLDLQGASQARFARDPKKWKKRQADEELASPSSKLAKLTMKPKQVPTPPGDDAWGPETEKPTSASEVQMNDDCGTPQLTSEEKRQKEQQRAALQETANAVKTFEGLGSMAATQKTEQQRLDDIFAAAGVHSVTEHDKLVNSGRKERLDMRYVEAEAEKAAKEAREVLRRNQVEANRVRIGTVTWTGSVGEAGRPAVQHRGSGIGGLGRDSKKWKLGGTQAAGRSNSLRGASASRQATPEVAEDKTEHFKGLIIHFLKVHGNSVPNRVVPVHFSHMARGPDAAVFYNALRELCRTEGVSNKRYVLKEEYRQ